MISTHQCVQLNASITGYEASYIGLTVEQNPKCNGRQLSQSRCGINEKKINKNYHTYGKAEAK
jgi:hypothetical protein